MTDPIQSLFIAIRARLTADYSQWNDRVFVAPAPLTAARPFVVYSEQSVFTRPYQTRNAIEATLNVRVVTDSAEVAYNCRSRLYYLLHNAGYQDNRTNYINTEGWTVSTTKVGSWLSSNDQIDNHLVFTRGFLVDIMMEQNT